MKTAKFIITNNTGSTIDSLYLMPDKIADRKYISLIPGQQKKYELSLRGQTTDGAYELVYSQNRKIISKIFGYYSNGIAMEKQMNLDIRQDTMIVR